MEDAAAGEHRECNYHCYHEGLVMSFIGFLLATVVLVSAVCVVAIRNPLYSAFSLVTNLLAVAGLYALLDAHFLAVSQIVVYAGAIMVLVLFVLMLLNLKVESGRKIGVTLLVVGVGVSFVSKALPIFSEGFSQVLPTTIADYARRSNGTVKVIGEELYTRYVVQFELSSLVLLIGIVGAVMLSRRRAASLEPRSSFSGDVQ
jgi:NADH-quinone oxidoreductase subunit J